MISHKGRDHSSLTITAAKVEPLSALLKRNKKHLEYQVMEQLIASIGRQLQYLERENKGVSSFNIEDITVFYEQGTAAALGSLRVEKLWQGVELFGDRPARIEIVEFCRRHRRDRRRRGHAIGHANP